MHARRAVRGPSAPADTAELTLLGGGSIWEENCRPLLEMLALYAGSGFDPAWWSAAEGRLADTDDESSDRWYTHLIQGGSARLVVMMARAVDEGTVAVRVWGDDVPGLGERVDTLFDIGNLFRLSAPEGGA
jgi:hypothetical protein